MLDDFSLLGVKKDWISAPFLASLERDRDDRAIFLLLCSELSILFFISTALE